MELQNLMTLDYIMSESIEYWIHCGYPLRGFLNAIHIQLEYFGLFHNFRKHNCNYEDKQCLFQVILIQSDLDIHRKPYKKKCVPIVFIT